MKLFFKNVRFKAFLTYFLMISIILTIVFIVSSNLVVDILLKREIEELSNEGTQVINNLVPFFSSDENIGYEKANEEIEASGIRTGFRYIVTDINGKAILDSHDELKSKNIIYIPEVYNSIRGNSTTNVYKFNDGSELIYYSSPIYVKTNIAGSLFISKSTDKMLGELRAYQKSFTILSMFILFFGSVISLIFSILLTNPIFKLNRQIKINETIGKIDEIEFADDEFSYLSLSINSLITQIKEVDKLGKGFISNVSHELRTPITSLKIISDTLVNSPTDDIEVYKDFMVDINGEMDHLNSIIDNLISLVNIEKDEFKLNIELFDISSVIKHRIENLRALAQQKNIEISLNETESIFIRADKSKIKQMVDNIVNNAIKYTDPNGKISVTVEKNRNGVIISVTDTGIGISEEDIPHIFDRFYMVDSSRQRVKGSSGIGLSICKQIATLHSGSISVESKLNVGSTFTIKLPIPKSMGLS